MVVYDLICDSEHQFEGWFKSESDYLEQNKQGILCCPICNSTLVHKLPSASYISTKKSQLVSQKNMPKKSRAQIDRIVKEFSSYITANTEDVGNQFAEEAKKMHYGEVVERNIRGNASVDEVKSLKEEGIDVVPLPVLVDKKKLN